MTKLTVGVCGTGQYSAQVAEALQQHPNFEIVWVVTPPPKPIGRQQTLTPSPLDTWASTHNLSVFHVSKKLSDLQSTLQTAPPIDYLLVISFGYLIPDWLLRLPKIAPVNVHPSALPKYRGSSPGQFVLLYGETTSAVSIMVMNTKFDQGAIIAQIPMSVTNQDTQTSYYDQAFALAADQLPNILQEFARNPISTPQASADANQPIARRLTREDGYLPISIVEAAIKASSKPINSKDHPILGPVLQELLTHQPSLTPAQLLDRASRALTPWPGIWTTLPQYKDRTNVRMKILETSLPRPDLAHIHRIQFEGETARAFDHNYLP
jgi:methionyl-tRNA formyltransferase